MKKLTLLLLFVFIRINAQEYIELRKTETTQNLEPKSSIIHIEELDNDELVCVQERRKKLSSNATYTFYHFNKDGKLKNSLEYKTKIIDKVFISQDSIYLLKQKKNYFKTNNSNKGPEEMFEELESVEYSYESSSINNLDFSNHFLHKIVGDGKHWNKQIDHFSSTFDESTFDNHLLIFSKISYSPNPKEVEDAEVALIANDSLNRTKHYNLRVNLDLFDKNLTNNTSKEIIITSNIGPIKFEDYKTKDNSHYILLSTNDKKKKKLIYFKRKINRVYHLLKIANGEVTYNSIDTEQHCPITMNVGVSKDKIVFAGLYSDTNDQKKTNGFFRLDYHKDSLKPNKSSYLNFTEAFYKDRVVVSSFKEKKDIPKLKSDALKRKLKKGYEKFYELNFKNIRVDESGDCYFDIEEYEIKTNNGGMMGMPGMGMIMGAMMMSVNVSNAAIRQKNIISAKISEKHELVWARNIKSKEPKTRFYISKTINGVHYIIKNDTPKTYLQFNTNDSKDKNDYLYGFTIDTYGNVNSQKFYPYTKSDDAFMINSNNKNADHIFVVKKEKKKFEIVKIGLR